jgi:hypothetical protein
MYSAMCCTRRTHTSCKGRWHSNYTHACVDFVHTALESNAYAHIQHGASRAMQWVEFNKNGLPCSRREVPSSRVTIWWPAFVV